MARVTAKADYALRAAAELAVAQPRRVKSEQLAAAQGIPLPDAVRRLADGDDIAP
jgi:DNA-binding IscR family transcriptional regulator